MEIMQRKENRQQKKMGKKNRGRETNVDDDVKSNEKQKENINTIP